LEVHAGGRALIVYIGFGPTDWSVVAWLPEPWYRKIWSWVPWDPEPRMTMLVRTSTNQREEWWGLVPDPPNRDREMLGWNMIFIHMFCILLCMLHFTPPPPKKNHATISTNNAHSYNTQDPIKDKKVPKHVLYIYIYTRAHHSPYSIAP
jgi:hypothetical protein